MLTTSGSTGLPKIVPLPAKAVDAFTDWAGERFDMTSGTVVLNYAPLNFDLCFLDIWATLKTGGCAVLVEEDQAANPAYLLDILIRTPVHVIQGVPMLYRLLLDGAGRDGPIFEAARHIIVTGDSIPAGTLAGLPRLFPSASYYNVYGCTETNDSFLHHITFADGPPPTPLPIGRPLPGVRILIVDPDGTPLEGPGTGRASCLHALSNRWLSGRWPEYGEVRAPAGGRRFGSLLPQR